MSLIGLQRKTHGFGMRRMAQLAAALALMLAVRPVAAQIDNPPTGPVITGGPVPIADASNLKQPSSFDEGWLVQAGDNPAWADPAFDDSQWKPINVRTGSLHTLWPGQRPEVVWYRLHLKVDAKNTSFALVETYLSSAFEIYANGERILKVGSVHPYRHYSYSAHLLAHIPPEQIATGNLVLTVRCHLSPEEWSDSSPGLYFSNLVFGQALALSDQIWLPVMKEDLLTFLVFLVALAMLAGAILLYSTQRRREYLFLALYYGEQIISTLFTLYGALHSYPHWWNFAILLPRQIRDWLFWRTYMGFLGRRSTWKSDLLILSAGFAFGIRSMRGLTGHSIDVFSVLLVAPVILVWVVALPWVLFSEARRGKRDASILFIPALIFASWYAAFFAEIVLLNIPSQRALVTSMAHFVYAKAGPFTLDMPSLSELLSALALALIVLLRSNRQSREQAVLEGEIANAREVQQVILPEALDSVPGFHVESVYEPAQQVGGDFFQVLSDGAGGLFAVVGDVAGKGLPAAMLVSVLVGAVRTAVDYTRDPAEVLAKLNERLHGRTRGGFSTAIAAHIAADGTVTIANAGHLSPYLDGKELELPSALPLGIDGAAGYETRTVALAPGSRLTFYSDGVPEARNPQGQLLGFERAGELATRPAAEIAETAKSFGQSDDITVVTIERAAAAVATAA